LHRRKENVDKIEDSFVALRSASFSERNVELQTPRPVLRHRFCCSALDTARRLQARAILNAVGDARFGLQLNISGPRRRYNGVERLQVVEADERADRRAWLDKRRVVDGEAF